ncbi:transglycosylase SLT domain-containing protein [Roseomonas sp. AR75]|uniref:transglycosylase SLT domain-containing protein n=1 Tax=Roseomonas sp. AR75 TaxID=2562311 RepID=UPI0010C0A526|nr:transglycosylase SLT domain-containing protein [Roseomonas sp. AR75]
MTRSRLAQRMRPIMACLLLGTLAACGTQQAAVRAPVSDGAWPRPSGYDPPGPPHDPWGPYISQASRRFDIPERWIREVMRQESGGRVSATSRVGAMGLMQVMPGTYAELTRRYGLGGDPYHPWDNLMAGTAYLREMYDLYGSPAFLAAYNAGPRRLEDYLWGSRGLPTETRNYVARIGPRIQGSSPTRRAPPEVYAAAELPLNIPAGPRRGDRATMLALREQRQGADPGIRVAQLPPGPVVAMAPIPDGSTSSPPAPYQVASAGSVVAMAPVASLGDFQRRMEPIVSPGDRPVSVQAVTRMDPIVSPGDPGTISAEPLAPPPSAVAAAPVSRGFSLIPQAQAGTLPVPPRVLTPPVPTAARSGGAWGVQVGAFASQNLARNAANQARSRMGVAGTQVSVERVSQGRSTLYRARVTGLGSRGAAEQACTRLRGGACMVVAPGA